MPTFNAEQRKTLGRKIREGKDRFFPGRGGCGRLAAELGITPQLLSHWMGGSRAPEPTQLAALAKLFHVSILELCSLPKLKKAKETPSALDVIVDVTKGRKAARSLRKNNKHFSESVSTIKTFIEKELDDFPS